MGTRRRSRESQLVEDLREKIRQIVEEAKIEGSSLTGRSRRELIDIIDKSVNELTEVLTELDPTKQPTSIFDPADPNTVGRFIALALVAQERKPLATVEPFYGSGIYAIYYNGEFSLYEPIRKTETPIYVGKTAPEVSHARTAREQGTKLAARLTEHRRSITRAASTLNISDFEFRALVVQSGWETAAEDFLVKTFHPIWNNLVYGFGKHGDAAATRANRRSPWDTLHPGRSWAGALTLVDAKSREQIERELEDHFTSHQVYDDIDSVLKSFVEGLRQV